MERARNPGTYVRMRCFQDGSCHRSVAMVGLDERMNEVTPVWAGLALKIDV